MHPATGKPDSHGDLGFQGPHPPAYSHGAPGVKKDRSDADGDTDAMDPNLSGARRPDGAASSYARDAESYRLDLLPSGPNLETNAAMASGGAEQDHVSRAFPFLSNSMGGQDGDSRAAAMFQPPFSNVSAPPDPHGAPLAYKKPDADADHGLHSKAQRGASYDSLAPPEKKETPYSRSPSLRVTHKIAERKRRKEMKDLFDELKEYVPVDRGPKTSKGDILTKAVLQFQTLHREREQLIEALEAAHQELSQLRQVAGHADPSASALPPHVYPGASSSPAYLPPRHAGESRLHAPLVHGSQDTHLSLRGDKQAGDAGSAPHAGLASAGQRAGEPFLPDLRLDRLRGGDDAVHPNFKQQLEHSTGMLDQSLGSARSFQPDAYSPVGLVSSDMPAAQDASPLPPAEAVGDHAARAASRDASFPGARYMGRSDGDMMPEGASNDSSTM